MKGLTDQHTSTLTIHNCTQSAYSCVRPHDMKTDWLCDTQSKVRPQLGLPTVTWGVDQKFQNFSGWRRWCWNDRWRGRLRGVISWWGWLWETDTSGQWVGQDSSQSLTISITGWGVVFGKTNSVHLEWQLLPIVKDALWLLEWPPARTHSCEANVPWCR